MRRIPLKTRAKRDQLKPHTALGLELEAEVRDLFDGAGGAQ